MNIAAKFNKDIYCNKLHKVALLYLLLNRNIDFISKFLAMLHKVGKILLDKFNTVNTRQMLLLKLLFTGRFHRWVLKICLTNFVRLVRSIKKKIFKIGKIRLKRHGRFVAFYFYCKIMLISISYNYCSVLTANKCFIETELTS